MNRTLHLTSPLAHGADVTEAQRLLTANVFGQTFYKGRFDGQFGEVTAQACVRAKFWIGYPPKRQKQTFGEELKGYLQGTELPTEFTHARQERLNTAKGVPLRAIALAEAKKHLGEKEAPPNSNHIRYSVWYGIDRQAWCAAFVTWCYLQAGSKAFLKGHRYAYVPYIVRDAKAGANNLTLTNTPQPGDLVCFDWDHDREADHVGLVEKMGKGGAFSSIEGNTAIGNDSNGGEVMRRDRNRTQVAAFVHVGR